MQVREPPAISVVSGLAFCMAIGFDVIVTAVEDTSEHTCDQ